MGASLLTAAAGVFGEGANATAVDLIARRKLGHVLADGLDRPGKASARIRGLRRAEPEAQGSDEVGAAGHHVPCAPVHARRTHVHKNVVISDRRLRDFSEPQNGLGLGAVLVLDNRLHRVDLRFECRMLASTTTRQR